MVEKIECDRCGKEIPEYYVRINQTIFTNRTLATIDEVYKGINTRIDLCKPCWKELKPSSKNKIAYIEK